MREEVPQTQAQELRLSVSDKEILQKKDFAQMSAAEIAQVTPRDREHEAAAGRTAHPPLSARRRAASGSTCAAPSAAVPAHRRRDHRHQKARTGSQAGADRGDPVRHLRLDEPLLARCSCTSCMRSPPTASASRFPVRHAADQRHAPAAGARSRSGAGAVGSRWRTGPAAPGSPPACRSSTGSGRAGCSARGRSCC